MLDIGWQELMLVCAVAVIVVGPKELPKVVRTITGFMRKMRGMASEFQTHLTDIADSQDVMSLKKDITDMKDEITKTPIASADDPTGFGDKLRELEADQKQIADTFNRATDPDFSGDAPTAKNPTAKKKAKKTPKNKTRKSPKHKARKAAKAKTPAKNTAKKQVIKPPSLARPKA